MKVLACSTHPGGRQELLQGQLAARGIAAIFGCGPGVELGHGKSWKPKLEWYRDELKSSCRPSEWVVLTDAWDVVFQGSKNDLFEHLAAHIPPDTVLISGEKNCWPDVGEQVNYPMGPTPWMFVNSGGIAGRAQDLHKALSWGLDFLMPYYLEDDQRFWTIMFLLQCTGRASATVPRIAIDYNCEIFQTMFLLMGGELLIREEGKLVNNRTTTMPFFLHWNGGSNWPDAALRQMRMIPWTT